MGALCDVQTPFIMYSLSTGRHARTRTHLVLGFACLEQKQAIYKHFLSVFLLCLSLHEGSDRARALVNHGARVLFISNYFWSPFFWPGHPPFMCDLLVQKNHLQSTYLHYWHHYQALCQALPALLPSKQNEKHYNANPHHISL